MPQSGIHAALSFRLGQSTNIQSNLIPSIIFGAILPDIDYIAVALGMIYYPLNLSEQLFHRTFLHSFFILLIIYLIFGLISEWKNNTEIKQIGKGIAIGMLSHIVLDTLLSFKGIHLLWPLPLREFALWNNFNFSNGFYKLMYIMEFFFFRWYAWFLIKRNIAHPTNNSGVIKYLSYWKKIETLLFTIFIIISFINYHYFKILFIFAYIPSITMSLWATYMNFDALSYKSKK